MRYIRPAPTQDQADFFYVVATSGDAVTYLKDGSYVVPDSVINLLNKKKVIYTEVPSTPSDRKP